MKKKIQIFLEEGALEELDEILKSPHCKNRGFKMSRGDMIEELISNFVWSYWEDVDKAITNK